MGKHIEFSSPEGNVRRASGYKSRRPQTSDKRYASGRIGAGQLPPRVDLREKMTPVENQGDTSSCVANAVAGAYEYLVKLHRGEDWDVSRLFIYYNARAVGDSVDPEEQDDELDDEGSQIADAIEGLRRYGACSEETWPFDEERVKERPDDESYEEASSFLVEQMELVPTHLDAWKHALAEGHPIIFGLSLYDSFDRQRRPGLVPQPTRNESSRESHSGHAMLAVGYSDRDRVFIVRNSWGDDWGDEGYCYIPYDYLMNSRYNDGDSWIIKQLENAEVDQATWDDDDDSVLESLDSALGNMSEEDFTALLDAMGKWPLEFRLAHLFLHAAGADGDVSEEEVAGILEFLAPIFEALGTRSSPERVLRNAMREAGNSKLLRESIDLLGEHLDAAVLGSIATSLREVVGADDLSQEEEDFLAAIVEAWQVGDGSEEEADDDEDDDDDDDEDDDDEDDEDEDEDGEEEDEDES